MILNGEPETLEGLIEEAGLLKSRVEDILQRENNKYRLKAEYLILKLDEAIDKNEKEILRKAIDLS